jgi:2-aminobenzoate-CoA ligase
MGEVPIAFLPPPEYTPETICLLPELNYPDKLNLAELLLDQNVDRFGDKIAIYFEDQRVSYKELQQRVNRCANALRELGVSKCDRVMLRSPNHPEYLVWNFACWRIGAIPVLINHLNRYEEVAFKANDSEAVAIFVHSAFFGDVAKALPMSPKLRHVIVLGEKIPGTICYEDITRRQSDHAESENTSRDDYGRLIYSSGTTGKPKGILTTLGGILSHADTHGKYVLKLTADDILGGHPYFTFAFGSVNFTIYPWRFGASVSIISRFTAADQLRLVGDHKITKLFAVPTAFRMMLGVPEAESKFDLSSMKLCQSAGEWLPGSTCVEWSDRFGVSILDSLGSGDLGYWLSTFEGIPRSKLDSTGVSVPGFQNLVVDENFNEVPPGTIGELIVRGPIGQLYWRRPDKQREGVCPLECRFRGWNRPGLFFMQDEDGYFWYKSRSDDMIVTSGYKVPGGEVEAALNSHPAVLESAVIDSPDQIRGTLIKAFVVLKDPYQATDALAKEIQSFVKHKIEPYKYPRIIEFVHSDDLPRTSTGKILRRVLRDRERSKNNLSIKNKHDIGDCDTP